MRVSYPSCFVNNIKICFAIFVDFANEHFIACTRTQGVYLFYVRIRISASEGEKANPPRIPSYAAITELQFFAAAARLQEREMIMTERLIQIKSILKEKKRVSVTELSEQFHVSKVTIRHDLALLETEHFANRTHGGAILIQNDENKNSSPDRETDPVIDRITAKACEFISNGDTLFLGPGKICCSLAQKLGGFDDLCVFTNNLDAVPLLAKNDTRLFLLGGEVINGNESSLQTAPSDLVNVDAQPFAMKAFVCVEGIDFKAGLTVPVLSTAGILRNFRQCAKTVYLMADHPMYDRISVYPAGNLEDIRHLITDHLPNKYSNFFQRSGAEIHLA